MRGSTNRYGGDTTNAPTVVSHSYLQPRIPRVGPDVQFQWGIIPVTLFQLSWLSFCYSPRIIPREYYFTHLQTHPGSVRRPRWPRRNVGGLRHFFASGSAQRARRAALERRGASSTAFGFGRHCPPEAGTEPGWLLKFSPVAPRVRSGRRLERVGWGSSRGSEGLVRARCARLRRLRRPLSSLSV